MPVASVHPAACGITVMASASMAGRTTTRLCPPLYPEEAAAFDTAFLRDAAANLLAVGQIVKGAMAYGPLGFQNVFDEVVPSGIHSSANWFPDFGAYLFEATEALFKCGHAAACVLTADSPTLPTAILWRTAELQRSVQGRADAHVGTRGATTDHLQSLIEASLDGGKAVVAGIQTALDPDVR